MIGKIVSNKMTGTVAVQVDTVKVHPLYGRRLRRSQKFLAKSTDKLNLGDLVEIKETRPVSKRVKFEVTAVINRAEVLPQVKEDSGEKKVSSKEKK